MNGNSSVLFTGLPSGISHIWVHVYNCSADGFGDSFTSIRLGTSSGIKTSNYRAGAGAFRNGDYPKTSDKSDQLPFFYSEGQSNRFFSGIAHCAKLSDNKWVMSSMGATDHTSAQNYTGGGHIDVEAVVTQIQIVLTGSGVTNWDAGSVNISYM